MTSDSGEIRRNVLRNRRWFLRYGGAAVPFIFVALRAQGAERAGTVEDVKGEASPRRLEFVVRSIEQRRSSSATRSARESSLGWACGSAAIRPSGSVRKRA